MTGKAESNGSNNGNKQKADISTAEQDKLLQVRDLLFGEQVSDIDSRMGGLQQSLLGSIEDLKSQMQKKLQELEKQTEKNFTKLSQDLKDAQATSHKNDEEIREHLEKTKHTTEEEFAATQNRIEEMQKEVNENFGLVTQDKVHRDQMAVLLEGMAGELRKGNNIK